MSTSTEWQHLDVRVANGRVRVGSRVQINKHATSGYASACAARGLMGTVLGPLRLLSGQWDSAWVQLDHELLEADHVMRGGLVFKANDVRTHRVSGANDEYPYAEAILEPGFRYIAAKLDVLDVIDDDDNRRVADA